METRSEQVLLEKQRHRLASCRVATNLQLKKKKMQYVQSTMKVSAVK